MSTLRLHIGFQIPSYFMGSAKFDKLLRENSKTLFLHVDSLHNYYVLQRELLMEEVDTLPVFSHELQTYESSFKNYNNKFLIQLQQEFKFNFNIKGYILND